MIALPPNADGTVDIFHEGHHFHIAAASCGYAVFADGSADPTLLETPVMTCTICGAAMRAYVPLLGDRDAQLAHAFFRVVLGLAPDLPSSIAAVVADIAALGGTPRISITDHA